MNAKAALIVLTIICFTGCSTIASPNEKLIERLESVHVGQFQSVVINLLGTPSEKMTTNTAYGTRELWSYDSGGRTIMIITLMNGQVTTIDKFYTK